MAETIGVIGLGAMGGIIAGHLLDRGFAVVGYDLVVERIAALEPKGLSPAITPREVAGQAAIVITSLPSAAAVRAVIGGVDGILEAEHDGQIVVETSTLAVDDKIKARDLLAPAGRIFLDAPISGTTPMLAAKMASIYVGGDEAAYRRCLPMLEAFTGQSYHVGEVGDASRMKYLANYLVFVHTVAAAECFVLGQKAGLDPALIHRVLKESAGTSRMFEMRGDMMARSDYRDQTDTVFNVLRKDAAIITEFAAQVEAPIDLFVLARQRFNAAAALGLDHLELAAVCRAIEHSVGIERPMAE
jgi:3-hydroxyisobutyrate dehydrogenase-like beta-hydroxyacid dehydrogenase